MDSKKDWVDRAKNVLKTLLSVVKESFYESLISMISGRFSKKN